MVTASFYITEIILSVVETTTQPADHNRQGQP